MHERDHFSSNEKFPVASFETSYSLDNSGFLGVPQDEQLIEDSSHEGIFHGRSISDVYTQDTQELTEAGVTWEEGVHVLKCLAIATAYQKELSEKTQDTAIPGFQGVQAKPGPGRPQYDSIISNPPLYHDRTPFDHVAYQSQEQEVTVSIGDVALKTTINMATLTIAERYHLLEKGNPYELTGRQLAMLVKNFDPEIFNHDITPWLKKEEEKYENGLQTVSGHKEKIIYQDGKSAETLISKDNLSISIYSPFYRIDITHDQGLPTAIQFETSTSSVGYHRILLQIQEDTWFDIDIEAQIMREPPDNIEVFPGETLYSIIEDAKIILDTAKNSPDGILLKNSDRIRTIFEDIEQVLEEDIDEI